MIDLPKKVEIHEEGPREGFQIEPVAIPTIKKIELIEALSLTGLDEIQIASFVSPRRVPGWADAEAVVSGIRNKVGVRHTGLWLNDKGFLRALKVGGLFLKGIVTVVASELFLSRNQNMTLAQNALTQRDLIALYQENAVPVKWGSIHAAFGCNYQGDVPLAAVISSIQEIQSIVDDNGEEIEEISLADTMGWATPEAIKRTVGAVREKWPNLHIRLHLHDTRGLGLANAYAGLEMGVSRFDSSVAGLGGCPFAGHKGAAGNICTEDLVFLCEESGVGTNVNLGQLIEAANLAEIIVGHPLPGAVRKSGELSKLRVK